MVRLLVKIGHAVSDENGKSTGGKAGNQNGSELQIRAWYNRSKGWSAVIRAIDKDVAEKIARAMEQACNNMKIGYDQNQRTTLYFQAKNNSWDISKIKTACETDCSALVAVCVNAAGIPVSKDMYTGNELAVLQATKEFEVFKDSRYLTSDEWLRRGDILLGTGHTAVVLSDGVKYTAEIEKQLKNDSVKFKPYKVKVTADALNVRAGAGTAYKINTVVKKGETYTIVDVSVSGQWGKLKSGAGWISLKYTKRV